MHFARVPYSKQRTTWRDTLWHGHQASTVLQPESVFPSVRGKGFLLYRLGNHISSPPAMARARGGFQPGRNLTAGSRWNHSQPPEQQENTHIFCFLGSTGAGGPHCQQLGLVFTSCQLVTVSFMKYCHKSYIFPAFLRPGICFILPWVFVCLTCSAPYLLPRQVLDVWLS